MGLWKQTEPAEADPETPDDKSSKQSAKADLSDEKQVKAAAGAESDAAGEDATSEEQKVKKMAYLGLVLFAIILSIVLKFIAAGQFDRFESFADCNGQLRCLGNQVVFRISFASFIFFMIMSLICCIDRKATLHSGWWCIKLPVYFGLLGLSLVIPNAFFNVYSEISRVVSIVFLILQVLILVDFAYNLHEKLIVVHEGEEDVRGCNKLIYLVGGFGGLLVAIAGSVVIAVFYGGCRLSIGFIVANFVLGLGFTLMSLTNTINKGLLTPAVVFMYATYVLWQSLASSPDVACNPFGANDQNDTIGVILAGLAISVLSLAWASLSAASAAPNVFGLHAKSEDGVKKRIPPRHAFFHLILAMSAMYMAMLLTNWGTGEGVNTTTVETVGRESLIIKLFSFGLVYALYLWTMIAPLACSSRDFS